MRLVTIFFHSRLPVTFLDPGWTHSLGRSCVGSRLWVVRVVEGVGQGRGSAWTTRVSALWIGLHPSSIALTVDNGVR